MSSPYHPKTALGRAVHTFEETVIAALLGLMTLVTFVNVVVRYLFNQPWVRDVAETVGLSLPTSINWALELVLILFAWLVMFGISYGFKITMHLGVDAVLNVVSHGARRVLALLALAVCLVYAFLLMKGAWDYWAPYANLAPTTGRWFPTGFEEMKPWDYRGYTPTERIPMPEILRAPLEYLFLPEGEEPYTKLPIALPYAIIPIGVALMLFRLIEAGVRIVAGTQQGLIVSHEAEDAVEAAAKERDA